MKCLLKLSQGIELVGVHADMVVAGRASPRRHPDGNQTTEFEKSCTGAKSFQKSQTIRKLSDTQGREMDSGDFRSLHSCGCFLEHGERSGNQLRQSESRSDRCSGSGIVSLWESVTDGLAG